MAFFMLFWSLFGCFVRSVGWYVVWSALILANLRHEIGLFVIMFCGL